MKPNIEAILQSIPQQPQRQDSTNAQVADLWAVANHLGLYDAADLIKTIANQRPAPGR